MPFYLLWSLVDGLQPRGVTDKLERGRVQLAVVILVVDDVVVVVCDPKHLLRAGVLVNAFPRRRDS